MLTLLAFIFVLGIAILFHEFGHFITAKLSGIKVFRFSLGFGPRIAGIFWKGTEYVICLFPFGGYVKMAGEMPFFIVEKDETAIGFFNLKKVNQLKTEIPLIYLDLNWLGKGVGKACIQFIEKWIIKNWPEVKVLFLDTIIPKYNSGFYENVGFKFQKETVCNFSGVKIKSKRYEKKLQE